MVVGENALAIVGAARAVTVRVAVLLGEPTVVCEVVTPEVVLGLPPTLLLVTPKVTVQPPAGIVIPEKVRAVWPEVNDVAAPQVPPTAPPTALILTSVSVKEAPVRLDAFVFPNVRVTVDVPPDAIDVGLKAFPMVGTASTVRFAMLLPVPTVV
jgi:hypothetical protein